MRRKYFGLFVVALVKLIDAATDVSDDVQNDADDIDSDPTS
jgi:hypothetical protein